MLDFMVKLLLSKELIIRTEFNSILVVVDRLMKWGMFISYRELSIVEDLVYVFL